MGILRKLYLVQEIEKVDVGERQFNEWTAIVVTVVISLFINYFLLGSMRETISNLIYNTGKLDMEMLGIIVGIVITWGICLGLFIARIHEGLSDTIFSIFIKMIILNTILMTIGSVALPSIFSLVFTGNIGISIFWLIVTTMFKFVILALCAPLISLASMAVVIVVGLILSFLIYNIIYRLKFNRIQRTVCWEEIQKYCTIKDIKNKILIIKLYNNKIQFFTASIRMDCEISFSALGYSPLKPIMQFSMCKLISKITKVKFRINSVQDGVITLENRKLERQYRKSEKESKNYFYHIRKYGFRIKKRLYKENVKQGKDW